MHVGRTYCSACVVELINFALGSDLSFMGLLIYGRVRQLSAGKSRLQKSWEQRAEGFKSGNVISSRHSKSGPPEVQTVMRTAYTIQST